MGQFLKAFFSLVFGVNCTFSALDLKTKNSNILSQFLSIKPPQDVYVEPIQMPGEHKIGLMRLKGEITADSSENTINYLDQINKTNPEIILIEIDSPGGNTTAGFEIARAIEHSQAPVICLVDDLAASMASYILQSCQTRIMTKRSRIMDHEPSLVGLEISGTQTEIENIYAQMHALTESLIHQYCYRTKIPFDQMRQRIVGGGQWWFNWEEALKFQVVDGVEENSSVLLKKLKHGNFKLIKN